jgi:hypothetical protein
MKRNLARKSVVLGGGGMPAAGLLSTAATAASAATSEAAQARGPAWRTVLSVANGTKTGLFNTVVATGQTNGWAFGGTGTDGVFRFNGRTRTEVSKTPQGGTALSDGAVWAYSGTQVEFFNGNSVALEYS